MLFLSAGSGYFSDRRQYVRLLIGMIVEEEGHKGLSVLYDFARLFFSSRFSSNALLFKYIVA